MAKFAWAEKPVTMARCTIQRTQRPKVARHSHISGGNSLDLSVDKMESRGVNVTHRNMAEQLPALPALPAVHVSLHDLVAQVLLDSYSLFCPANSLLRRCDVVHWFTSEKIQSVGNTNPKNIQKISKSPSRLCSRLSTTSEGSSLR